MALPEEFNVRTVQSDTLAVTRVKGGYIYQDTQGSLRTSVFVSDEQTNGGGGSTTEITKQIVVNQSNVSETLGGTVDPTSEYLIDGVIDMSGVTIVVPSTGIYINGLSSEVSQLVCSDNSYTMFDGTAGSGNIFISNISIEVDGTGSKVYDLVANSGSEAFEVSSLNYNNCTSLGEVDSYRQGLEDNTSRFGGTPSLTLSGTWVGGYRLTTTIVRGVDDAWTGSIFQEGTSFLMNSRFLTDINCDLGTLSSFMNFTPSNFNDSSLLQLNGCIFSRGGVINPTDTNILPNISASDLQSVWKNNQGVNNTYVGGIQDLTSTSLTNIVTVNVPVVMAGTYTTFDLQHFDSPSNGQLRNLGSSPRDFQVVFYCVLDGGANDVYTVRVMKYDSSSASSTQVVSQQRQVNNLIGGADVTDFSLLGNTSLDVNDYVYVTVENNSDNTDCTALVGTFMSIKER